MRIFDETETIKLNEKDCDMKLGCLLGKMITINGKQEQIFIYHKFTKKQLIENEVSELKYWFETEYKEMFQKYNRKITLGLTMKDGSDPKEGLKQLYLQAEKNANRINELNKLMEESIEINRQV